MATKKLAEADIDAWAKKFNKQCEVCALGEDAVFLVQRVLYLNDNHEASVPIGAMVQKLHDDFGFKFRRDTLSKHLRHLGRPSWKVAR